MRSLLVSATLVSLGLFGLTRLAAQDDGEKAARQLALRTIEAMGGAARLDKVTALSAQIKADFSTGARTVIVEMKGTFKGAESYRLELESLQTNPLTGILIGNGGKAWVKAGDPNAKFNVKLTPLKDLLFDAGMANDLYALQLAQQPTALLGKEFQLSIVGDLKVGERAGVVYRVVHANRPDVNVCVDKETALPIRCEMRLRSDKRNQEFVREILFADYKDVDGCKRFTKATLKRDDEKVCDIELSNIENLEKVEASTFAEP
jgi:hypothetical protein